eukprot:9245059-Pyramimonas_sp.AAC.2
MSQCPCQALGTHGTRGLVLPLHGSRQSDCIGPAGASARIYPLEVIAALHRLVDIGSSGRWAERSGGAWANQTQ